LKDILEIVAQPTATLRAPGDVMSCPSYGERVEMQPGTMSRSGAKENKKVQLVFCKWFDFSCPSIARVSYL